MEKGDPTDHDGDDERGWTGVKWMKMGGSGVRMVGLGLALGFGLGVFSNLEPNGDTIGLCIIWMCRMVHGWGEAYLVNDHNNDNDIACIRAIYIDILYI